MENQSSEIPDYFAVGDSVSIPGDPDNLHGVIRKVDVVKQKLLIEFIGGEDDGMEEWWPMHSFKP